LETWGPSPKFSKQRLVAPVIFQKAALCTHHLKRAERIQAETKRLSQQGRLAGEVRTRRNRDIVSATSIASSQLWAGPGFFLLVDHFITSRVPST
jgi:hypothetical protein